MFDGKGSSVRPGRRGAAVLAILLAGLLGGCGTGDESEGDGPDLPDAAAGSSSASEDASPDGEFPPGVPTDTEQPEPPDDLQNDQQGAASFAEYAFDVYQWAGARNDVAAIEALGSCPSCDRVRTATDRLQTRGQYQVPDGEITVLDVDQFYEEAGVRVIGVTYRLPELITIDEQGEVVDTLDAQRGKVMEVAVRWQDGAWTLVDIAVTD